MTTYLNGQLVGSTTTTNPSLDGHPSTPYFIGGDWNGAPALVGEIGEIRIYNYPFTQAQVTADYNAALASYPYVATPQVLKLLLKASSYSGSGLWNDETGTGNNATLTTGTIAKNVDGNGIVLDGLSTWQFPNPKVGSFWTVGVWYKNVNGGNNGGSIVTQQFTGNPVNMQIAYDSAQANFLGGFWNNGYGGFNANERVTIPQGQWANIQITWDGGSDTSAGGTMTTYLNGQLVGSTTTTNPSLDGHPSVPYFIGGDWNGAPSLIGEIGEVRIYNYPLTQAQVTAAYNASAAIFPNPAPLRILLNASSYSGTGAWNDESGLGNNATLADGTAAKNVAGNGIVLDGQTSWTFPNVAVANAWTASVWYKSTGTPTGVLPCILTQIQNESGAMNCQIGWLVENGGPYSVGFDNYNRGTVFELTQGEWVNIQGTWDGTNLATYINGALIGTTQPGSTAYDSGLGFRIGRRWDGADYMIGEIGEVRIYNYPLTQAEVTNIYNASAATFGL
jgi:hypothetical protein